MAILLVFANIMLALSLMAEGESLMLPYVDSPWLQSRATELSQEVPKCLAEERRELIAYEERIKSAFVGAEHNIVYERLSKRQKLSLEICDFVELNLKKGDAVSLQFAERALDDLKHCRRYFEKELNCWRDNPENPRHNPVVLNGDEYGISKENTKEVNAAFQRAFAAVRELGGQPCVLRIPEGQFLTTRKEYDAVSGMWQQLTVADLTNCVITGVSPEKTHLVFGVYKTSGIRMLRCYNVKLSNLQFFWQKTPFAEGRVVEVDAHEGSCVVEASPGCLRFDDPAIKASLSCQWTEDGLQCFDSSFAWMDVARPAQGLEENRYRIFFNRANYGDSYTRVKPHRFISVVDRSDDVGLMVLASDFVTLEDIWCRNSRSAAFSGASVCVNRCRVFPRQGFMLSTNADGFYSGPGSYLSHSLLTHMHDDGNNSHTYGAYVADTADDRKFFYALGDLRCPTPGELMFFVSSRDGRFLGNIRVESAFATNVLGKGWQACVTAASLPPGIESFRSLGLETVSKEEQQDIIFGRSRIKDLPTLVYLQSNGDVMTVVTDTTISSLRGTGIPVQSPNELIENTTIANIEQGLHLCALSQWLEGPPPYNTIVRDVSILGCSTAIRTQFQLPNHRPGASAVIRGCRFERVNVDRSEWIDADLKNLGESIFSDCRITGVGRVMQTNCENVVFKNCTLNNQPYSEKRSKDE